MVILKWVQSVLLGPNDETTKQSKTPSILKPKEPEFLDIAHEVVRNYAEELSGLVNTGQPIIERRKMKEKIKGKIKKTIAKEFDNDDIVEEVTERILDAAEFDPHYKEMFED